MTLAGLILLALLIGLPIGWLASEFSKHVALRIVLGILALCTVAFCTWTLASVNSMLMRFGYNTYYGEATKDLIETSLEQIEKGNIEQVEKAWTTLNGKYLPTYENRANYDQLAAEAVESMRQAEQRKPDEDR